MPPVGKIEQLDDATRSDLDRLLVQYRFGRLADVSAWLREQGQDISVPTVGRYSKELKEKMDQRRERVLSRIELHKACGGLSDADKAALMESGEIAAYDQVLDLFDEAAQMDVAQRAKFMPDVVRAIVALSGGAKKTADFRKQIEAEVRRKALEDAAGAAKEAGASDATVERIRELLERGG